MLINVGSQNKVKISAVKSAVEMYPELFTEVRVKGVQVEVEEFGHPQGLNEILKGAVDRARAAFKKADLGIGIESGLQEADYTLSGYVETTTCAVFDGKQIYPGIGASYEWPAGVAELITKGEADGSQAFKQLGYTDQQKMGAMEGGICGYLTKGRLTREQTIVDSLIMAFVRLERKRLYQQS